MIHTTCTAKKRRIFRKRHHAGKRWIIKRTNLWHIRFRKLFTRYEKKVEIYLSLVQLVYSIIIYRKVPFDTLNILVVQSKLNNS